MSDDRIDEVARNTEILVVNMRDSSHNDGLRIAAIVSALRSCFSRILILVVVFTSISFVASFVVTPSYRAEVSIIPVDFGDTGMPFGIGAGSLGGLAALAGVDLNSSPGSKEGLAVLKSRKFISLFILENDLLPLLFAENWDEETEGWKLPDESPTINDAVKYFHEDVLQVLDQPDEGIVAIRIHYSDRELAAKWANDLVASANNHIRSFNIARANKSIEFLKREQAQASVVEIKQGINQLIKQQVETVMLANVQTDFAFKVIDPAIVPDADDYVFPNRSIWVLGTFFLTIFLGFLAVIIGLTITPSRTRQSAEINE